VNTDAFYVGDPWYIETTVKNTKTGALGKPGEVKALIYSPKALQEIEEGLSPAPAEVALAELSLGVYEGLAVAELPEAGIWRCTIKTTAPFVGVQPDLITVQQPSAL
jgi:hypothetical protein